MNAELPPRDRKYSMGLIGGSAIFVLAALTLGFAWNQELLILGSGLLILLLLNHFFWKIPFFPYDRILSAVSTDGIDWQVEPGVRLDVGGRHASCQVYYPEVVAVPGGWRMYYRAGGYDSIIASAFSRDGLEWEEEPGVRIGPGGEYGLTKVDGPEVMDLGGGEWRMYYGGYDGEDWRICSSRSQDGLDWKWEAGCIGGTGKDQAKDPCVIRCSSGYRMYFMGYFSGEGQIYSAISQDGVNWRDIQPCSGYNPEHRDIRNPCVIEVQQEKLRMYFAEFPRFTAIGSRIVSVVSEDGLNWMRDSEVRVDPGACPGLQGTFCPDLLPHEQGWRMYYGGYWGRHWLAAYTLFRHRERKKICDSGVYKA